jgi:hypothetical protein
MPEQVNYNTCEVYYVNPNHHDTSQIYFCCLWLNHSHQVVLAFPDFLVLIYQPILFLNTSFQHNVDHDQAHMMIRLSFAVLFLNNDSMMIAFPFGI